MFFFSFLLVLGSPTTCAKSLMPIPPREREKSHLVWLHFYNIYSLIIANAILRKCQWEREKILQHHKGTKATRRDFGARAWDADDCYAIRKELKMKNSAFGIWKCEWRRSMSDDKKKHENWLENDAIFSWISSKKFELGNLKLFDRKFGCKKNFNEIFRQFLIF